VSSLLVDDSSRVMLAAQAREFGDDWIWDQGCSGAGT
jgi:hypothetical protein